MAGKKGLKKRVWSDDEKRTMCEQTLTPGVSVAQVARRYSMNSNLIFKWLKDPRFAPAAGDVDHDVVSDAVFLPIEIAGAAIDHAPNAAPSTAHSSTCRPLVANRVDVTLSDGRRIVVDGPTSLTAVLGLVEGLMS